MLTMFWDMKGIITINFLEKGAIVNTASYRQFLGQNSPYLFNNPYIIFLMPLSLNATGIKSMAILK